MVCDNLKLNGGRRDLNRKYFFVGQAKSNLKKVWQADPCIMGEELERDMHKYISTVKSQKQAGNYYKPVSSISRTF